MVLRRWLWGLNIVLALFLVAGLMLQRHEADSPADFVLESHAGPFATADQRGKVVVIYFGYASCPDVCPTSLASLEAAFRRLDDAQRKQVLGVLVSVDPERDAPEDLARYVAHFGPDFVGVTGTPAQIAEVAGRYGAVYMRSDSGSQAGYLIDHSSLFYLLGPDGTLAARLPSTIAPDELAARLATLLADA